MIYAGDSSKREIEVIKENKIFSNKYIEVYNDDVIFPSGDQGTYLRVTSGTNRSVAVLPITKEGNLVVIRSFRHGMRGWGVEVPKGSVNCEETHESAAIREMKEETGYVCEKLIHLCEYSESPAVFSNYIDCYVALGCRPSGEINQENTEAIDKTFEISLEDFLERNYHADFIDALSELLVYQYCFVKEKWGL